MRDSTIRYAALTVQHSRPTSRDISLSIWGCKVSTHLALPGPSAAAACTGCRIACDNVRDCVFLKDDLNSVKKGSIHTS